MIVFTFNEKYLQREVCCRTKQIMSLYINLEIKSDHVKLCLTNNIFTFRLCLKITCHHSSYFARRDWYFFICLFLSVSLCSKNSLVCKQMHVLYLMHKVNESLLAKSKVQNVWYKSIPIMLFNVSSFYLKVKTKSVQY